MEIYVNSQLSWNSTSEELEIERVLWISAQREHVAVINMLGRNAMPRLVPWADLLQAFESGAFRVLVNTSDEILLNEEEIPEHHRTRRDESWQIIEPIVTLARDAQFDARERGAAIQNVLENNEVSKTTVYTLLRRFWQRGQARNSLLPDYKNCGAPGKERSFGDEKRGRPRRITQITGNPAGINIGDDERKKFELGIKAYYENRSNARTFRQAYQLTLQKFFSERLERRNGVPVPILPPAEELPSFDQFRYWYEKNQCIKTALIARGGERRFNLNHRALGGDAAGAAVGPGSIYQIDSTPLDVNLVSLVDRRMIVGRPTLYLVVDVFSRLICGFCITTKDPSYVAAGLALENAMQDKVEFCAMHGVEITAEQWPAHHVPETLIADRGELAGKQADHLARAFGITVGNTPPFRADLKPFVERMFRTINDYLVHDLPGAVPKPKARGERDTRLDASLNIDELRRLLITTILHYNRSRIEKFRPQAFMVADDVEPRPIDIWSWGIKNRSGHLRAVPSEHARLALLPGAQATVTAFGIKFRKLFYSCEKAIQEQWFVRARQRRSFKVNVGYDPRDASVIYLRLPGAKVPIVCRLIDQNSPFRGLGWVEVEQFFDALQLQKEKSRTNDLQAQAAFDASVQADVKESRAQAKVAASEIKQSNAARLRNIREHRSLENDLDNPPGSSRDENLEYAPVDSNEHALASAEAPHDYISPPNDFELLRKERDEQWTEYESK